MGEAPASSNILPPPPPEFNEGTTPEPAEVGLSARVASVVGGASSPKPDDASGLQDALASALSGPDASDADEADAPVAKRRSARMTNPLGIAAISDENSPAEESRAARVTAPESANAPTQEPPKAAAESTRDASAEKPETAKKPESAVDRYVNMAIAIVGGLILAWLLLTWLTR